MSFFGRTSRAVLPPNASELLADWGRREFDRVNLPSIREDTDEFIMTLERRPDEALRDKLIQEIRSVGLRDGEWTAYGAFEVLVAFLYSVPQEILDDVSETRVRFLLGLGRSDIGDRFNSFDFITLKRLDPQEYARLSPS
jgi:hypothetical protein